MKSFQTQEGRFAMREALFLGIAALGAWLFLDHELLEGGSPPPWSLSEFLVSTIVVYLFLRTIVVVVEMRTPRMHAELVRCPECGQWLDDPTAAGRAKHHQIEMTPKPSEREIVSAVALRKAFDAARVAAEASRDADRMQGPPTPLVPPENISSKDLVAAIDDPDLLERLRHGPNPPSDPRLKR